MCFTQNKKKITRIFIFTRKNFKCAVFVSEWLFLLKLDIFEEFSWIWCNLEVKREKLMVIKGIWKKSVDWKWNRFEFPLKAHFDLSNLFKRILVALQCKNKSFVDHLTEPFSHRCGRIEIGAPLNYNEKLSSLWILLELCTVHMYINQFVMNFQSWCFPSFDKKETVPSFLLNIFAFVVCEIFWCVWYDFLHFFIAISKFPINSFIYIWSTAATVEALSFGITLVELWNKKRLIRSNAMKLPKVFYYKQNASDHFAAKCGN